MISSRPILRLSSKSFNNLLRSVRSLSRFLGTQTLLKFKGPLVTKKFKVTTRECVERGILIIQRLISMTMMCRPKFYAPLCRQITNNWAWLLSFPLRVRDRCEEEKFLAFVRDKENWNHFVCCFKKLVRSQACQSVFLQRKVATTTE